MEDLVIRKAFIENLAHPVGYPVVFFAVSFRLFRNGNKRLPAVFLIRYPLDKSPRFHAIEHAGEGRFRQGSEPSYLRNGQLPMFPQHIKNAALRTVENINPALFEQPFAGSSAQMPDLG